MSSEGGEAVRGGGSEERWRSSERGRKRVEDEAVGKAACEERWRSNEGRRNREKLVECVLSLC